MHVVATSDTHLEQPSLPDGDVLIHAGDLINDGLESEFLQGINWLADHPHPVKIYVPGNHDRFAYDFRNAAYAWCKSMGIHMLVDETLVVNRIAFYGDPWTKLFGKTAAYMLPPEEIEKHFTRLVRPMDVLITHSPPFGHYDANRHGTRCGSEALLETVLDLQPAVHLFGHIHEGHGGRRLAIHGNGKQTLLANVCATGSKMMGLMLNDDPVLEFDIERQADGVIEIMLDGETIIC